MHGPMVMKGYLNNPKATAEALDESGWLHSGDKGYYDEDGWFYIVGRYKELIKCRGYQVKKLYYKKINTNETFYKIF